VRREEGKRNTAVSLIRELIRFCITGQSEDKPLSPQTYVEGEAERPRRDSPGDDSSRPLAFGEPPAWEIRRGGERSRQSATTPHPCADDRAGGSVFLLVRGPMRIRPWPWLNGLLISEAHDIARIWQAIARWPRALIKLPVTAPAARAAIAQLHMFWALRRLGRLARRTVHPLPLFPWGSFLL
jgi:hypothetical protein